MLKNKTSRGRRGGNTVNFGTTWFCCLLVLLLLVTPRTVTSNGSQEEDDDNILDLDSFPVPTHAPVDNSDEPEYSSGEASSPGSANKAPDITPYLNINLPVPTNGGKPNLTPSPVPTVPSPSSAEKTPDQDSGSFSEWAYPTESMNGDEQKDVPTIYPKEDKEEDTVSFSEEAYPSATIAEEKETAVPTIYPSESAPQEAAKDSSSEAVPTVYADSVENESVVPTLYTESSDTVPTVYTEEGDSKGASEVPTVYTDSSDTVPTVYMEEGGSKDASKEASPSDSTAGDEDAARAVEEKGTGDEKESKPEAPAKEGSLASFFEKVNKKKDATQDNLSNTFAAASQVYTAQAKKEGLYIGDTKKTYRGVWGELQPNQRRPNMMVLFELFQDAFVEAITGSHTKAQAEALVDDMGDILESKTADIDVDKIMAAEPDKVEISNTFVDGLDDIDKLFEDVDPPDELDIASFGSSMQEILMGRASHIARKRLMMGVEFVKKSFVKTKTIVVKRFTSEDGRIRLMTKDGLKQTGLATLKVLKSGYTFAKELVDDLLDSSEQDSDSDDTKILGDIQEQLQKQQRAVPL